MYQVKYSKTHHIIFYHNVTVCVRVSTSLLGSTFHRLPVLPPPGICTRCGEKVVGEGTGCTAMEQVYHIKCFVCIVCHLQLQGKPFYALDSKPYCEDCYLVSPPSVLSS